ncbi:substrate-binding domain-containing protein [Paenibacillus sp. P25]|nr:substrate-binding domain-containing protein [Paenibacillus sp. P25]
MGILVPSVKRPYFGMVVEGIADEALQWGCNLMLIQTNYEEERELEAFMLLKLKQIDALIICSKTSGWDIVEEYNRYGPIVVLEDARGRQVSSIFIDHYKCFTMALSYLTGKGHEKIGYCLARKTGTSSMQREAAYRDFYTKRNQAVRPDYFFYDAVHMEDGQWIMQQIAGMPDPRQPYWSLAIKWSAGILVYCRDQHIEVPGQLAIVGFDNQPIAKVMNITTFAIPLGEIGRKLFLLAAQGEVRHLEIETEFIERLTV